MNNSTSNGGSVSNIPGDALLIPRNSAIVAALILTLIVLLVAKTGHTQTVNCEHAFTNLERAICTNPELKALDNQLERLLTFAVRKKFLTARARAEIRNGLAVRCGGSEDKVSCLMARERDAISRLSLVTGQVLEIAASHRTPAG